MWPACGSAAGGTAVFGRLTGIAVLQVAYAVRRETGEPRFVLPQARLVKATVVGETHVSCIISGRDGGRLKAIAFRAMEGPLGPGLLTAAVVLLGTLALTQVVTARVHDLDERIVRRLVEGWGGTIGVESEVGRGTVFTIRFAGSSEQ